MQYFAQNIIFQITQKYSNFQYYEGPVTVNSISVENVVQEQATKIFAAFLTKDLIT